MQRNSEIVREKRGNREKRSFFPGCDGNGEGSRFSQREKKRQASMERLRYVLFCRNGEKAVDGGTGICYTIIWYFTVLVWLSWQSSSLVMSRSPVRIRPQAPKKTSGRPPAGKTVKLKFLGTGMISVMPVPLLAAHPRECSPQGRTRYVPSACACRWTCPVRPHRPPSQAL